LRLRLCHLKIRRYSAGEAMLHETQQAHADRDEYIKKVETTLAETQRDVARAQRYSAALEKRADPPAPEPGASAAEVMAHRLKTKAGRELYALRKQTIEPVFGIIKEAMGFRRFSLRGLANVRTEWTLVTLAYNLKRPFPLAADPREA